MAGEAQDLEECTSRVAAQLQRTVVALFIELADCDPGMLGSRRGAEHPWDLHWRRPKEDDVAEERGRERVTVCLSEGSRLDGW